MRSKIIVSTLISCGDKYLFIRQKEKDDGGAYRDTLHLVGGSLEENETLEEGARREVLEEVNIKLDEITPFDFDSDVLMYKGEMTQLVFLRYTAEIPELAGEAGSDAEEIFWIPKKDLLKYNHNEPTKRFLKKLGLV